MQKTKAILIGCMAFVLILASCKDKASTGNGDVFDRTLLLEQVTKANMLPAFDSLAEASIQLRMAIIGFSISQQKTELQAAQNAWRTAFRYFQWSRMFNFGPSENQLLGDHNENLGTWPIDTALVESRIQAGDTTMLDFRRDTRGFGALEYLLFEPNALGRFQGPNGALRMSYLHALAVDIQAWSIRLKNDWLVYSPSFSHDDGKSAGSATSELYNHWLQSYELIKNYKVALPAGLQVGQTAPAPHLVESPYANASIASIKWHLEFLENIWLGKGLDGVNQSGFDDYLLSVSGGSDLHYEITQQWTAIHAVLDPLSDDAKLTELVVNDPAKAQALFTELQKMTRFIKGDMSSLLGIAITFSSGDGD